jgi:hypothetical protein
MMRLNVHPLIASIFDCARVPKKTLLAGSAHVVAVISLGVVQNSKIDASEVKQRCDLARDLSRSRVVRRVVAHEPKHVD